MQLRFDVRRLFAAALRLEADLYLAHTELALYAACQLLRRGYRAGVDMEDWYSEDLLPQARRRRPISLLRSLEREALLSSTFATCPSQAMSQALGDEYGGKRPLVLYNSFPWADRQAIDGQRKDRRDSGVVSICWYSQTLGPGRGIEDLIAALPLLRGEFELHLRGQPAAGMEHWIRTRIPERWRERVFFHPLVANDELLSRIAEHDIGFAGETQDCRSRDLTVTNKMLQYLLGGLAVVASNTAGQREVAARAPGAIALYQPGNPRALAAALDGLLSSPDTLDQAKRAALQAAQQTFCWERQEPALLAAVAAALGSRPQSSGRRR
jgi:glycosyltransferase involved in cell wall biosynthesis